MTKYSLHFRECCTRSIRFLFLSAFMAQSLVCAVAQPSSGELPANDDGSTGLIPLGFTFRLFGTDYNALYVNNNGNLTFLSPLGTYTPFAFPSSSGFPMIAAFFADVDTRNGKGRVRYEGTSDYFTVRWENVGYYNANNPDNLDYRNTFSITLQKNNGIIFQYGQMQWTTGDASGGSGGFGGAPATLGLDRGNGVDAVVFRRYGDASVAQLQGTTWYFQTDKAVLPVPPYKQCGGTWGSDHTLNSSTEVMCGTGCFVTSTAMLLNALGHNTDPGKLNIYLRNYMSGGSLLFNNIPQDRIFFGQTDNVPGPKLRFRNAGFVIVPTAGPLPPEGDTSLKNQLLSQIGAAIDTYGPVIVRIPSRNWGSQGYLTTHTHAGAAYAVAGDDILIREPGWAASPGTLSGYATFVNNHVANVLNPPHPEWQLKNADGQGTGQDFSWLAGSSFTFTEILTPFSKQIIQGQANSPVELVITDPHGRRLGFNPTTNVRYNEIPGSSYFRELDVAPADESPLVVSERYKPLVFEIGDFVEGSYAFDVFGLDAGPWSVQFGVSDPVFGYNPVQYRQAGSASTGSHQAFSRVVTSDLATPPDQTPPEVVCSVTPEFLWPPDHKMVNVNIIVEAQDETTLPGNVTLVSATVKSSEPDNGVADGDKRGDSNGQDGFSAPVDVMAAFTDGGTTQDGTRVFWGSIALRAERAGTGDGRIYTIQVTLADEAGNVGTHDCVVVVMHDRGVDLNDPAGTFRRIGPSKALQRVFEVNRHMKYQP